MPSSKPWLGQCACLCRLRVPVACEFCAQDGVARMRWSGAHATCDTALLGLGLGSGCDGACGARFEMRVIGETAGSGSLRLVVAAIDGCG